MLGGIISSRPSKIWLPEGPAWNNSLKELTLLAICGLGGRNAFLGLGGFLGKTEEHEEQMKNNERKWERMREKLRETCEMPKETNANRRERKERTHARTRATDRRPAISGSSDESRKVYNRNVCGLLNNSADAKVVRRPNHIFFWFSIFYFFIFLILYEKS